MCIIYHKLNFSFEPDNHSYAEKSKQNEVNSNKNTSVKTSASVKTGF